MDGNQSTSANAEACLTARETTRAGTKVGISDPAVPNGRAVAQRIKATLVLKGLGSPAPYVKGNYTDHTVATYYGEAMAVVQADGNGPVKVTVADEERFYVVEIPCE